ncbi:MAG TPA: MOSC N-terminal beta barrel domain-containing protein [Steroidobacteraceae bacterium]
MSTAATRSTQARIRALHFYPVKSAAGLELEQAVLTTAGFADDRRWMLVTPAGRFLTQRELPRMALLCTALSLSTLQISPRGCPLISISLAHQGRRCRVQVWKDQCDAFDEGDEVARSLSGFLKVDCRLVRFDPAQSRRADPAWTGGIAAEARFADAFPLLALNAASLEDLNGRLPVRLPVNRFRPNIVLEGLQPYDEDHIDELSGDGVRLRLVKPCTRCRITTTNQDTGEVEGDEPLHALRAYRYDAGLRGLKFGHNAIVVEGAGASLHRGQTLTVRWRQQPAPA